MKFNAPTAASFLISSLRNSGTRWCKSSMLIKGALHRVLAQLPVPIASLKTFHISASPDARTSCPMSNVQCPTSAPLCLSTLRLWTSRPWTLDLGLWTFFLQSCTTNPIASHPPADFQPMPLRILNERKRLIETHRLIVQNRRRERRQVMTLQIRAGVGNQSKTGRM